MRITRSCKIVIVFALVFVAMMSLYYMSPGIWESREFRAERRDVTKYLKEKYGQDFNIKKMEYYWWYLGSKRQIRSYVVSKDDPPIEFIVARLADQPEEGYWETSLFLGQDNHRDYLELKWNRESEARFKEVAEEIFSRPTFLYTSIVVPSYYRDQKFGTVPSYFDTLKNNPGIFHDKVARQYIQLVFFDTVDEANRTLEVKKIYTFMNELRKMGIQNYRLAIDYFEPDFAEEAQRVISRIGLEAVMRVEHGWWTTKEYSGSRGQRINCVFLQEEDVNNIKDSTDISKFFKK